MVIDLHCHVLPGIDDGPATMEESVALARAAAAQGTRTIVATPHVTWDHPHNTAPAITALVRETNAALAAAGVPVDVLPGGEVAMSRAGDLHDEELSALRLGGGPWLLVECPFAPATTGFDLLLRGLASRGHRIILGHPERSPAFQREPERLEQFVYTGMLAQVTAASLTGTFGREVQRSARLMLDRGLAHVVASDAHDPHRRSPAVAEHVDAAGYGELRGWLTEDVPAAVLAGTRIPPRPVPLAPPPRGLLERLGLRRAAGSRA